MLTKDDKRSIFHLTCSNHKLSRAAIIIFCHLKLFKLCVVHPVSLEHVQIWRKWEELLSATRGRLLTLDCKGQ